MTTTLIPTNVGYSKRLIIALIAVAVMIIILFITFIFKYSPKPAQKQQTLIYSDNDPQPSMLIQKIQQSRKFIESIQPIKQNDMIEEINEDTPPIYTNHNLPTTDNFIQEASQSEISVFNKPNSSHEMTLSHDPQIALGVQNPIPMQNTSNYESQNQQYAKEAFVNQSHRLTATQSDYHFNESKFALKPGTFINATLLTSINSDLPGHIIAKVNRPVFDTKTGNYQLIPQGTTLMGVYDSNISYGQSRLLMVWTRMIFPNGDSIDLQNMPGVDLLGMMGLHDKVNYHYSRVFGSALLFSMFSAAGQLSQPKTSTDELTNQQIVYSAIGQQLTQTGNQLIEKNTNIQPTIQVRAGTHLNVLLTNDLIFPQAYT